MVAGATVNVFRIRRQSDSEEERRRGVGSLVVEMKFAASRMRNFQSGLPLRKAVTSIAAATRAEVL